MVSRMWRRHRIEAALFFLALIFSCVVAPVRALAVGPLDGAYSVVQSNPTYGTFLTYIVVIQNGSTIGFASLDPSDGTWTYGFGTLSGSQVTGTLFRVDGTAYGTFLVTVTGTTFSGTFVESGIPFTCSGSKFL